EGLAQVNDVDTMAGIEDEFLHLGVPAPGLMPKVDARFQQFFNANTYHKFPWVNSPSRRCGTNHPAEHGIHFDVVPAAPAHSNQGLILRPFRLFAASREIPAETKGRSKITNRPFTAIIIFACCGRRAHLDTTTNIRGSA